MDAKRLLGGERQEDVLGHAAAVAMDAKWLLSRADESVVAFGCCVKWAGLIMQISRVGGVYCVRILILLERLCSDPYSIPTYIGLTVDAMTEK